MRHGKKLNHLGRKTAHRQAMLSNMAASLILHKRINTTLAKAKALRVYIEPLVTKAKANTTHARRTVYSYLASKEAVHELFGPVRDQIGDRPGGYVRVIRTGTRPGDGAEKAMIEFVDFNHDYVKGDPGKEVQKRRTRRGKAKAVSTAESTPQPETQTETPAPDILDDAAEHTDDATEQTDETAEQTDKGDK